MRVVSLGAECARVDRALADPLTVEELRTLKDELLVLLSEEPSSQGLISPRMARVNLRLREADQRLEASRRDSFHGKFYEEARRLLEPAVFDLLCRAAQATRESEEERSLVIRAMAESITLEAKEAAGPAPAAKVIPLAKKKLTPMPATPLTTALHRLVSTAQNRPLKFDPARLFAEFGRERVLATWNMLPAEDRPETANGFRQLLLKLAATGS